MDLNLYRTPASVRLDAIDTEDNEDWETLGNLERDGLMTEVAYWRRFEPVMRWVETKVLHEQVKNCGYYRLTRDEVARLGADCLSVLADPSRYWDLLEGDPDDLRDGAEGPNPERELLADTVKQVADALVSAPPGDAFWFSASW